MRPGRIAGAVAGAVALLGAESIVRVEHRTPIAPASASGPVIDSVYVVDWGHHTSIVLPADARESKHWVEVAWGDRRYFMTPDPGAASGFRALFFSTSSTVLVVDDRVPPPDVDAGATATFVRGVTRAQLDTLRSAIERSIDRAHRYGAAGSAGIFYRSPLRYSWWNDCNRWTVEILARAGLAGSGRGVVFARNVGPRLVGFQRIGGTGGSAQGASRPTDQGAAER